jgi:hypothetical protein
MIRKILMLAVLTLSVSTLALAEGGDIAPAGGEGGGSIMPTAPFNGQGHAVDKRQANQNKRINKGVKNGTLTQKEYMALEKEQQRIRRVEKKANADGTVTADEQARLKALQKKSSQHIYNQKHDKQNQAGAVVPSTQHLLDKYNAAENKIKATVEKNKASGKLTDAEAAAVDGKLAAFEKAKTDAAADGLITGDEHKHLAQMLNNLRLSLKFKNMNANGGTRSAQ